MPEVRLIDSIELVRYMCGACPSHQNGECIDKMCWKYEDRARIENAPTIEAEPVRRGKGCEYCKGRAFTNKPLTVTTRTMKRVQVVFNFCPKCGRKMNGGAENDT